MGQVLKTLVDQTSAKAYSHHRMIVIDRIQLAQVHEFRGHFEQALSIYESVLKEIPPAFQAIGLEISEETDRRVKLKALPDSDLSKKVDLRDNQDLISMLKMRLDLWLELKHRTLFFMAACYHAMASYSEESQEPQYPEYAEKENMYYKYATGVRREILGADESNIKLLNDQIYSFSDSIAKEIRGPKNEFLIYLPSDKYKGGIRFAALFEKVQVLSENLNEQWQLIDEWRFSIIQLVTKPLEDAQEKTEGDLVDPSGEEYAEGLDNQEKLITLVNCYRRLLYDRIVLLTGFRNESGDHDHESSIISGRYANSDYKNDHYFAPLDSKRLQFSPAKDEKGLRVLISQMLAFSKRTDVPKLELKMADCAYKEFVDLYDLQQKIMRKLEMELNNISDLMVHRRDYYSRLQKLSDGVVPLNRPENVDILESVIKTRLDETQVEFASIAGRKRYLEHLLNEEKKNGNNKKDMECGICRGGMEKQSILPCGHYFCNGCLFAWLSRHRKCPVCNQVEIILIIYRKHL
jgi:E3 ubiquitin-protein ligase SHPRH